MVNDAKDLGVDAGTEPVIYTAGYPNGQILLVRTRLDLFAVAPVIRQTVSSLDRNLGISDLKTMDEVLADSLARPRVAALVLGFFAFLSVGLAAIGVYGVLAFIVTQRTREIGVRLALGAQRAQVRTLFLKQGAILVLAGGVVGLGGALIVGRLLGAILFETTPADPLSAMITVAIIVVIGITAVRIPAERAGNVDPMKALRAD